MSRKDRRPIAALPPDAKKQVRLRQDPSSYSESTIAWRIRLLDRVHDEWGWHLPKDSDKEHTIWSRIHNALKSYETMSWATIDKKHSCHSWSVTDLPKKAQEGLLRQGLKLEQLEGLYQLAVGSKGRIFGIRDRNLFSILWWDSEHTVFPTEKKHT